MTRSKSRRTRRNRRRRGGKKEPIASNTPPFAGAEGWITADNHLTDLTTQGGCAMMLGKRGTLLGRSGWGGEYGKIAGKKMNGYDGKTDNKVAMMKFNLGCDKGNGVKQLKKAWAQADFGTRAAFLNKHGFGGVVAPAGAAAAAAVNPVPGQDGSGRRRRRKKRRKSRRKSRRKRKKSRKQRRRR